MGSSFLRLGTRLSVWFCETKRKKLVFWPLFDGLRHTPSVFLFVEPFSVGQGSQQESRNLLGSDSGTHGADSEPPGCPPSEIGGEDWGFGRTDEVATKAPLTS